MSPGIIKDQSLYARSPHRKPKTPRAQVPRTHPDQLNKTRGGTQGDRGEEREEEVGRGAGIDPEVTDAPLGFKALTSELTSL